MTVSKQTDMLIDQDDTDVFPLLCKALERRFDGCSFCLAVDDEKVLLRFGAGSDMLYASMRQNEYFLGGNTPIMISRE
jgi:hypothetical protein